jgi:hypothetical protein
VQDILWRTQFSRAVWVVDQLSCICNASDLHAYTDGAGEVFFR